MYRSILKPSRRKTLKNIIIVCVIFAVCFLMSTGLSSYVFYPKTPQLDSSVFRYVGLVIQAGGVPYRDTFDHKGPLIYLINYFGLFIGQNGIWFFELAALILTGFATYRIFRLFCRKALSLVGTCIVMLQIYDYLGGGNYTEEYALPLITIGLLVFVDYFIRGQTNCWKLMLCGASFMGVMLLRPNMVGTWMVCCVAVLIKTLRTNPKKIPEFLVYFLVGMMIAFSPIAAYLIKNGAFRDFWEQYILFNISYSKVQSGNAAAAIRFFLFSAPCLAALLINLVCLMTQQDDSGLNVISIIYILVSVGLIGMSGRIYGHYGIILAPLSIIPFGRLFQYLESRALQRIGLIAGTATIIFLICNYSAASSENVIRRA